MLDRLQYKVFYFLWSYWHMWWRKGFDHIDAKLRGKNPNDWMYGIRYAPNCRPGWHLCCNGDAGGWRTKVCDYLETKWRNTKHYNKSS